MAKHRHRTFEMFDFPEEASLALGSKATRVMSESEDPVGWAFHHLFASRTASVIHVRFKSPGPCDADTLNDLRADFSKLSDALVNDSQVLLDFEGVSEFCPGSIEALESLNAKLKSRGSRLTICNLEPAVQASFFPHRKVADKT